MVSLDFLATKTQKKTVLAAQRTPSGQKFPGFPGRGAQRGGHQPLGQRGGRRRVLRVLRVLRGLGHPRGHPVHGGRALGGGGRQEVGGAPGKTWMMIP